MATPSQDLGTLLTAMITPFNSDGKVNFGAAQSLARHLVENGSDGVVLAGTTGEAPTLTDDEKLELVRQVRAAIPGRTVIAGTGGNDTHHSIELSRHAVEAGADGILAVVPYYSKPTQEGIFQHFRAIAEAVDRPLVMYNIQSRSAVNMSAATTLRCAHVPGIVGVKEASGDIDQMGLVCAGRPPEFRVWSGDDSFTLPLLAVGGHGVICVISHIAGPAMRDLIESFARGDTDRARDIHHRLLPVIKALMTTASNPIPIKSVLNELGFPAGPFRLPMAPMPDADLGRVMEAVRTAGDVISFSLQERVA